MSRFHVRIFAALFALGVLGTTILGGMYFYRKQFIPEKERRQELEAVFKKHGPKSDPGKKVYDQAMVLIRRNEPDAARVKLTEILDIYRDSSRYPDARRVLGEMNMDRMFSRIPMPGKLEYPVGRTRQDNLNSIAARFRSTVPFIKRVNNLLGSIIHPGDRLVLYPLDFEIEVNLEERRLTVMSDGRFFKDYAILGQNVPTVPRETTVGDSFGWLNEKRVRPEDERFSSVPKRIQTASKASRTGVIFCPEPPAAAEGEQPSVSGIFLSPSDMEELSTIVRPGIPLRFQKAQS